MRLLLLLWALSCLLVRSEECSETAEDGTCRKDDKEKEDTIPMPCEIKDDSPRLYRWDPVRVGHRRKIRITANREVEMITRALKPLMFEIPNFLSSEECDELIEIGKSKMMVDSMVHDVENRTGKIIETYEDHIENILAWDSNVDEKITFSEMRTFAKRYKHLHVTEEDMKEMLDEHNIKPKNEGYVTAEEFVEWPFKDMHVYFAKLKLESPIHRDRYSFQAWIQHNKRSPQIIKTLQNREEKLTKMTREQVRGAEPLQIVKYTKHGHFNTHHDGQDKEQYPDLQCCHLDLKKAPKCRLCRFMTIMYYLNDVEEGGETAFPFADNATLDVKAFEKQFDGNFYDLRQFCYRSNIVLKPVRGTAIMWYNHHINETTGWLGSLDRYSFHGGCHLKRGTKWIANTWITAPDSDHAHKKSDFLWKE